MIKRILISSLVIGSIALLPSCAGTNRTNRKNYKRAEVTRKGDQKVVVKSGARPAWVDGNSSEFPESTYLTAVGSNKVRKSAENNARMEMSQIFNTEIEAVRVSVNKAHAIRKNGKVKLSETDYTADTAIKNSTESIFAGLELSRYWKTKKGVTYVLATINKTKVLPPLKEKIRKIDDIIEKLVQEAQATNDKLIRTKKLYTALDKAVLREYYNAQVAIMSSRGQTVATNHSVDSIIHLIDNQLEKLSIAVAISGAGGSTMKYVIYQVGGDLKVKISDSSKTLEKPDFEDFGEDPNVNKPNYGSDADILITGSISFEALDRGDKYKWVKANLNLSLKNQKTNENYNAIVISDKVNKWTLQDAKRTVAKRIAKELRKKLKKTLKKVLGGK